MKNWILIILIYGISVGFFSCQKSKQRTFIDYELVNLALQVVKDYSILIPGPPPQGEDITNHKMQYNKTCPVIYLYDQLGEQEYVQLPDTIRKRITLDTLEVSINSSKINWAHNYQITNKVLKEDRKPKRFNNIDTCVLCLSQPIIYNRNAYVQYEFIHGIKGFDSVLISFQRKSNENWEVKKVELLAYY